ncbi:hypothetical protein FNV43_RR05768 [Rhamnella rubrinervis]|uniref:Uncharacterized protein n=1 Tax=Rhamnella rubrinervis TaxID=2594499 RepID=A0A8K0HMR2_9ROSA|nr:hypothetical protein FNV43_RR05768 [Rhamnella rubrinervis]
MIIQEFQKLQEKLEKDIQILDRKANNFNIDAHYNEFISKLNAIKNRSWPPRRKKFQVRRQDPIELAEATPKVVFEDKFELVAEKIDVEIVFSKTKFWPKKAEHKPSRKDDKRPKLDQKA